VHKGHVVLAIVSHRAADLIGGGSRITVGVDVLHINSLLHMLQGLPDLLPRHILIPGQLNGQHLGGVLQEACGRLQGKAAGSKNATQAVWLD